MKNQGDYGTYYLNLSCNIESFKPYDCSENFVSDAESQTTRPNFYKFKDIKTNRQITVIDTPGLSDTRGSLYDEDNVRAIINAICFMKGVNAICIVHNASEARISEGTEIALFRINESLPKEYIPNIVTCLTNAPDPSKLNCLDALKKLNVPLNNIFTFENKCIVPPSELEKAYKSLGGDNDDKEDTIEANTILWRKNKRSFFKMLAAVKDFNEKSTELINELYITKVANATVIEMITSQVLEIELQRRQLKNALQKIEATKVKIEQNKDFVETKVIHTLKKRKETDIRTVKAPSTWGESYRAEHSKSTGWKWARWASLGTVWLAEATVGALGSTITNFQKDYVTEDKEAYVVDVDETVIENKKELDELKQKVFEDSKRDLAELEISHAAISKQLIIKEDELQKCYRVISYLETKTKETAISYADDGMTNLRIKQVQSDRVNLKRVENPSKKQLEDLEKLNELEDFLKSSIQVKADAKKYAGKLISQFDHEYLNGVIRSSKEGEAVLLKEQYLIYRAISPCEANFPNDASIAF